MAERKYQTSKMPVLTEQLDFDTANSFSVLLPKCVDYWRYDEDLAEETISKYRTSLGRLLMDLPYLGSPLNLHLEDITQLKKIMRERGVGPAGINSVVFAMRKFLTYCKDVSNLPVLDPKKIMRARGVRGEEVIYLKQEEIIVFFRTINAKTLRGLRMRMLCHVLLATGMRISEALSLDRKDIDWERKESAIIGKGNKRRVVHYTDECLRWLKFYLSKRADEHPALFITSGEPKRLQRYDLSKQFRRYAKAAGINKKVSPHIFRHTFATQLINNGCPPHILQKLLGHSDIKTTLKYYCGADREDIKAAHEKYLRF